MKYYADAAAVYAEAESLCDQFTVTTGVSTLDLHLIGFSRIICECFSLS